MNLLCPNCQKPLSVPEQYAGQPMRCPLCAGTFTVPALPQTPPPPPPAAAPPPPPPEPRLAPAGPADVYGVKDTMAPPRPPPPAAAPDLDLMELPADAVIDKPTPPRPPAAPGPPYTEEQPTYPATPVPEGYHRRHTIWASPKVLQYVAPVAVLLVFVLSFFHWTGVYPGGVESVWQNAWQATVGGWSEDTDVTKDHPPFPTEDAKPGLNVLLIFFLLLLIPTLLITLGCLALAFVPPSTVPHAVHPLLPWRWGAVGALNLVLLLFLVLQMVLGFSLEDRVIAATDNAVAVIQKARGTNTTEDARNDAIMRGMARQEVSRTIWLDLVVLFLLVAVLAAALMFWLNRRGARPAPRADYLW